jgi:GT2 family glycosyltransferase
LDGVGDGGAADGVTSDQGYVLFLDDDVALHPGTIGRLADELEKDPSAFMATGGLGSTMSRYNCKPHTMR